MSKRAAFFLGSGISRLAKAPMVGDITDALLKGVWKDHTDTRFFPSTGVSSGEAQPAQEFMRLLKAFIDPHLLSRENRESNYEDLFAAALQIVQDETGEIVNPLLRGPIEEVRKLSEALWRDFDAHIDDNAFASLVERATDLIQWVVFHGLFPVTKPVGIESLSAVAGVVSSTDIFSLNHDLLIEQQLIDSAIPFADGFSEVDGDVVRFNWSWNESVPVRLYKLHGSINWYRFRFPKYDQFAKVASNPEYCRNATGEKLGVLDAKPLFLTGTTVKEQLYGVSLVGELFAEFRIRLRNHHTLICCGYGWLDKGINTRLRQWLYDAPENRIVILHNNPIDELRQKPYWFWRWDNFVKTGKVVVVPKWLSECDVIDLKTFFSD